MSARAGVDGRTKRARTAAVVVVLTLLAALLAPPAQAMTQLPPPGASAPTHRVDVRRPGADGLTLKHPLSDLPYRVVRVAPGIGVTDMIPSARTRENGLDPDGAVLSEDRFQTLVDRVSDVLDRIRATPTGALELKAIPHLVGPDATSVWTVSGPDGSARVTSDVQIVFAGRAHSGLDGTTATTFDPDLAGVGSMISLSPDFWEEGDSARSMWFDPASGEGRILSTETAVHHELMHAVAAAAGAEPTGGIWVLTPEWTRWPLTGPADGDAEIQENLTEVFAHGGPGGLTRARAVLTSPGPKGEAPVFTKEEFPSIGVDPWFLRAQRHATDRSLAAGTPAAQREAWRRAAAARLSMALHPPTELTFARERGVVTRPEYNASMFELKGELLTTLDVTVPHGFADWEAPDLRGRTDVVPMRGTWEAPEPPDLPPAAPEGAPSRSASPGGSEDRRGARSGESCLTCAVTVHRRPSQEDAAAFKALVAAEVGSAFEGPRAVQRRVLADPVGDAIRQVKGPGLASGVWARYPKVVAGLEKASFRFLAGSDSLSAAGIGLDVLGLVQGDVSALSITNTTADIVTTIAPMLGSRIATTVGGAGAVVGFITSTIAFSQGGSETDYIFSMAGMLTAAMPELAPFMILYTAASIWSRTSPVEGAMDAGQQMAVAFKDWALPSLEKQAGAMADAMRDAVSDRMDEARYRADYLQTKVDLEQLSAGDDLTTGGGPSGGQEQKRLIREATDQELARIAEAGVLSLDQGLDALLDVYNNGAVFTEFRKKWADTMNDNGGVSINGFKHHVDLDALPTTNPTPVHVDEFTTPLGSIRTTMQSRYRHALDALPLWAPSKNAFATPIVTEEKVLATVAKVQRDWGFTAPAPSATVDGVTSFTGTGTPGSFVQIWNPNTHALICGATKVNTVGLWVCRNEKGFQEPGISSTYELYSSTSDTSGFASTGKTVTVTTTGKLKPKPVVEWGPDLRVEGRTVIGTVTPGAVVQLQTMPQDSIDATKNGLPISDPVTAADGHFTLTARPDAPGGSTRLVASFKDHTIAERIVLDGGPTVPARIPESVEDSPIRIVHLTSTSIEGVVPAGQKLQLRLGEDPALPPVDTDGTGSFRVTFDRPLPNPQTITLRSWPADKPWQQSTRTVVWAGHDQ
ncbi:hypothetical protein GSU69_03860 [Rathayibacter festucae]|uniref:Uncharacterized protein n=1 Tax=Rathayibacter festucae TaxID=110937 RepID=A0ABX6GWL4_9MICO|nr:hypothetical protein [Rathayibacter festucae]QHC61913.1 hypothetical protein GSU69_03860 [Rathayibacter festucae]